MVGASELPFRLLCRKYGTQLAYTPMMDASRFAASLEYRKEIFQTTPDDRPLVCHFSANRPQDLVRASKLVQHQCDAIDLNLGCPQRIAFVEHFGSYLLDEKDRSLVCDIVKQTSEAIDIPVFVKIRLLHTVEETLVLCRQLQEAGASLIAIHARYRASHERKGAGARDGAAILEHVRYIKQHMPPEFPIVTNGNVITYAHVEKNLEFTNADGIMCAEGILDNPALYQQTTRKVTTTTMTTARLHSRATRRQRRTKAMHPCIPPPTKR